ncbi:hypothetical protein K437DRAFT_20986 [Tilletiaria anomala UBC 951]|uniref:Uncharacterized protein n=1 Tax=Tilletiaria anomala (strain ATCC 24038 / CBS 436.72 / UBC 951) TaxID=1037660 RepID=A0A066VEG3_TILAU|nr:uncharacterized protein K437DRAFT_20986 [Tilletiaria anomala UBC 951]KDN38698.1 hypothetical protein K437DRAFT_20986 [Tilletiaria anomala UBC 951]
MRVLHGCPCLWRRGLAPCADPLPLPRARRCAVNLRSARRIQRPARLGRPPRPSLSPHTPAQLPCTTPATPHRARVTPFCGASTSPRPWPSQSGSQGCIALFLLKCTRHTLPSPSPRLRATARTRQDEGANRGPQSRLHTSRSSISPSSPTSPYLHRLRSLSSLGPSP